MSDPTNAAAASLIVQQAQRAANAELVIQRYFAGKNSQDPASVAREASMRFVNPGPDFAERFRKAEKEAAGGFGPKLEPPSAGVEETFRQYAQTDLGAKAITLILAKDKAEVAKGWRKPDGSISDQGISAYGEGRWRPFRVASHGHESAAVTATGTLMLPDEFPTKPNYPTGEKIYSIAVLHHELKAHVFPLKREEYHGWEAEARGVRFENEMLRSLGLPERELYWGNQSGLGNKTLHVPTMQLYRGLVKNVQGELVEFDRETGARIGPATPVLPEVQSERFSNVEGQPTASGRSPKDLVPLSSLPSDELRKYLPLKAWAKEGFVPHEKATGRWFSVEEDSLQGRPIHMYSSKSVVAVNSEDQRNPTKVARQEYLHMAQLNAQSQGITLVLDPDRGPDEGWNR